MGIIVNSEINDYHLLSANYMPDALHFSTGSEVGNFFFSSLYFSGRNT